MHNDDIFHSILLISSLSVCLLKECIEHRREFYLLKLKYCLCDNISTKLISLAYKKNLILCLKCSCCALRNDSYLGCVVLFVVSIIRSLMHRNTMFLSFLTNTHSQAHTVFVGLSQGRSHQPWKAWSSSSLKPCCFTNPVVNSVKAVGPHTHT